MKKVLCLVFVFIISFACKKIQSFDEKEKVISGFAYAIQSSPIYKDPDTKTEILLTAPKGSQLEVFDHPNRNFWKVSYGGKIGFVPRTFFTDINKNFVSVFYHIERSDYNSVYTHRENLRLRDRPFLDAKVITVLEKNKQVFVIAIGKLFQAIDFSFDIWYLVKTEKGEEGFIYGGFTYKHSHYINDTFLKKNPLWMDVRNPDGFVAYPGADEDAERLPSYCGSRENGFNSDIHGGIELISGIANHKGINYYLLDELYNDMEGCDSATLWISEKEVTLVEDVKAYTEKKYAKNFDPKLLKILNVENYKALSVRKLEESEKYLHNFFQVEYATKEINLGSSIYVYQDPKKDYFRLVEASQLYFGDMNKDKIPEIFVCYTDGLNSFMGDLFVFQNGDYQSVLQFTPEDEFSGVRFTEDRIEFAFDGAVDGCPFDERFSETAKKISRYKLVNGSLQKLK
ncbi:SH3 domain-containing protein [Leptospira biflexa]|uniref:SH3 domain-containing protein n=1 Tax=Leptospira biflexa TaxID=172 RepID=UPI001083BFBD|nr:SH3 domain-containing protein [Leptospira biflexa]TGM37893.1 SH3 domain-containing protein [Leptospira biflexa]TGM41224.1 SH3 domain-containing protein [Leptospira biflexa]TGM47426.1 SH3 domain-containing protein [Leptospira biflexa]TGM50108.1 SH3 domain-containing protein [Leptospira biflexa]